MTMDFAVDDDNSDHLLLLLLEGNRKNQKLVDDNISFCHETTVAVRRLLLLMVDIRLVAYESHRQQPFLIVLSIHQQQLIGYPNQLNLHVDERIEEEDVVVVVVGVDDGKEQ